MAVFSALAVRVQARTERIGCCLLRAAVLRAASFALVSTAIAVVTPYRAHGDSLPKSLSIKTCSYRSAGSHADCGCHGSNFVVRSFVGGPRAADVARHCEEICAQLSSEVFGLKQSARWTPKCVVVLHPSKSNYLAAVGGNGAQTIGSSTISLSGGRVTERRIDLLAADPKKGLAALPHELVHVLFVDAFPASLPPKWAEEGLALVMDPAEKQSRHRRDLATALRDRSTLPVSRLLADENYPSLSQRAAFYGQSLSLVEYLMRQAPPADFVRFVKLSTERGAERALADVYQLNSRRLERDWRLYVTSTPLAIGP